MENEANDEERSAVSWEDLEKFAEDPVEMPRAVAERAKSFLDLPHESVPENELLSGLFRALGHKTRIQIIDLLLVGPASPSDIAVALELPPNDVSYHL